MHPAPEAAQGVPPLPAAFTHAEVLPWLAQAQRAVAQAPAHACVVVQAAGVQSFDSAALAALLALRRVVLARGLAWRIEGLPDKVRTLARAYGVDGLLPG
ncbi:STAS domain protein [Tepidimonas alkaliphilus]|uniref:STAS domain protein n=1 Tax=Tepidimonas alkaliphilus TaxID=2588942 RepID=A0A554W9L5_9BURK|nr:STAS domain-containing protein [Tepidimonas alkaliphilus]TSE20235.1 STAS domain protein [Tepidimonas alkaliphilus]